MKKTIPRTGAGLPADAAIGRRRVTAHDVARLAGVSQSAVSRSFTEGASVSDETRRRVLEAAKRLGYRPNLIARSLITRRSYIVGVAMAYLENQFYPKVLEALSAALGEIGYRVLLFTPKPGESSDPILEEVLRYRVDALVLASTSLSSHLAEECRHAGVPVVLLNRRTEGRGVSSITGDNERGARAVAAFLAAGQHRSYAFVAGLEDSSTSREREAGYTDQLLSLGFGRPLRATGHYTFEGAVAAARALLSADGRPDAVFCANDHMALAVINIASSEFGLRVGQDVSVVGFDDAGPAGWPLFDLTTYAQPVQPMVDRVVSVVRELLLHPERPAVQEVVPGHLVVRGSARIPATGVTEQDGRRIWIPPADAIVAAGGRRAAGRGRR